MPESRVYITEQEQHQLKHAMDRMGQEVYKLALHTRLRNSWENLQKAVSPALLIRREDQGKLF